MIENEEIIETENDEKEYITMGFDPLFKKMFGDSNYTNKAAALIGIFLNIPYDEIKDRVEILNNQKIRRSKKEKYQEQDVLVHVKLVSGHQFINLEANIHGYNQLLIDRNTGYVASTLSRQLDKGQGYEYLEPVLQINFNEPTTEMTSDDLYNPIDEYMLRNKKGKVLTNMLKIINIDIDKCYNLWYNNDIDKFTSCEQNIIKIGALHKANNDEEFRKCLGEIEMDEEVKKKIEHDMDEYQQDKELAMVYNKNKHDEFVRRTKEIELDNKRQQIETIENKVDAREKKVDAKEKEVDAKEKKVDAKEKEVDAKEKKINEQQEKFKQEKITFAKNLLNENISVEKISKITDLTIEEIKEIEN